MSVYNSEKYLKESIESILNQTYSNFEFIIINDGSKDQSWDIIEYYAKQDGRIRAINNKENKGLIFSLNLGLNLAKGEYIVRMDSDDISMLDRIEKQYKFMKKNQDTVVAASRVKVIKSNKELKSAKSKYFLTEDIKVGLFFNNVLCHPSVIIDKKKLNQLNLDYSEKDKGCEDYGLWIKCIRNYDIKIMDEALLKYRIVENGVTQSLNKNIEQKFFQMKEIYIFLLEELDLYNEENLKIHFDLTNNIENFNCNLNDVLDYFNKILNSNSEKCIYNEENLKKELGKRWILLGKNLKIRKQKKFYFNKYIIYGLKYIFSKIGEK